LTSNDHDDNQVDDSPDRSGDDAGDGVPGAWEIGQPWTPRPRQDRPPTWPPPPMPPVDPGREPSGPAPIDRQAPVSRPAVPPESPVTAPVHSTPPAGTLLPPEPPSAPVLPPDATIAMPATAAPSPPPPFMSQQPPAAAPPPPPTGSRVPPPAPGDRPERPRRRGFFSRLFRRLLVLVVIIAVVVGGLAVWADSKLDRIDVGALSPGRGPDTVLIVGSDSRENLPDDLAGNFGDFAGSRSDVIILAHASGTRLQMLSLPRDLKVSIPGEGTNKINAAYAFGGPDLLVETIQSDLGIPIAGYLEVQFGGFASIVDAVGGVELTFEYPTRDLKSGLEVDDAGPRTVDGATALAYVRSRHTEQLRDGDWQSVAGGDIQRTGRQRKVLSGIVGRLTSPSMLFRAPAVMSSVASSLRVDRGTHVWDLAILGLRFKTASDTESMALPVTGATEGGVSYVVRTGGAAAAVAAFVAGEPLPVEKG